MRSAQAPTASAGVMMKKVIWNMTNTVSGMVKATAPSPLPSVKGWSQLAAMPDRNRRDMSPK
jgi:hypothetical protein